MSALLAEEEKSWLTMWKVYLEQGEARRKEKELSRYDPSRCRDCWRYFACYLDVKKTQEEIVKRVLSRETTHPQLESFLESISRRTIMHFEEEKQDEEDEEDEEDEDDEEEQEDPVVKGSGAIQNLQI